jgi:hypothetical protein
MAGNNLRIVMSVLS